MRNVRNVRLRVADVNGERVGAHGCFWGARGAQLFSRGVHGVRMRVRKNVEQVHPYKRSAHKDYRLTGA